MKKSITFLCLAVIMMSSLGAQESINFKPTSGEWGVQLTVRGIGPLIDDDWSTAFLNSELHLKYTSSEKLFYTLGVFVDAYSDKFEIRDSVILSSRRGIETLNYSESQTGFYLIPGIEKHFPGTKRIDPFISVRIPLGYYGKYKENEEYEERSVRTNGDIFHRTTTDEFEIQGGFEVGLAGSLGINYYVANRIALGIDYSLSMSYISIGGNIKESSFVRLIDGTTDTTNTTNSVSFDKDKDFEFSNKGVLGLNVLFFFGKSAVANE